MKINFREIYNNIRDKDMLLIWAVALGLLILLVLVSIVFFSNNNSKPTSLPTNVQLDSSQFDTPSNGFSMDASVLSSDSSKQNQQAYIYKTSSQDLSENIKTWLSDIGKSTAAFTCDDLFCNWNNEKSTETLSYSKIAGTLSFTISLTDKISPEDGTNSAIQKSKDLLKAITGRDYEFTDAFKSKSDSIKFTNGEYRYYSYKQDNGLPIWGDFDLASGNYIGLNKDNEIFEASFQVLDLIKTDSTPVNVIPDYKVALNIDSYGQKYFPDPISLTNAIESTVSTSKIKYNNDVNVAKESVTPDKCKVSTAKLGVRAYTTEDGNIMYMPSYKFDCSFSYLIGSKLFDIPGVTIAIAY